VYRGEQLIVIKIDGSKFPNGDGWKCVTCDMPAANAVGISSEREYPQTFRDGTRLLAGTTIFDCSPHKLIDEACTGKRMHAYPIRWNVKADGSGDGGAIRELRIHPDNVHLGFNSISVTSGGKFDQFGYLARLEFKAKPTKGAPLAPRYDLTKVTRLFKPGLGQRVLRPHPTRPRELIIEAQGIEMGEFRGFTGSGQEATYVGYPLESSNIDAFAVHLTTGKVRRLTEHPEYVDPLDFSPDDKWFVALDTRGSDRQMFVGGMRWIPPVTDLVTSTAVSSYRNNGQRRFFSPILIDGFGDRGSYFGQPMNAGEGKPGSSSDPNWNAKADPRWSADGTTVVYGEAHVMSPACGGVNPLPCPVSTEPGGRHHRIVIARLISRAPLQIPAPAPISDEVPWGTPYVPGAPSPERALLPEGTYTLRGKVSGQAQVTIGHNSSHTAIATVSVIYDNYADVAGYVLNGTETVTGRTPAPTVAELDWFSDLRQSGNVTGRKLTSSDGFKSRIDILKNVLQAQGTLTTTLDGKAYSAPASGT
jgi:hypothetical protein